MLVKAILVWEVVVLNWIRWLHLHRTQASLDFHLVLDIKCTEVRSNEISFCFRPFLGQFS